MHSWIKGKLLYAEHILLMAKNIITLQMNRKHGRFCDAALQKVRNRQYISVSESKLYHLYFLWRNIMLKAKMLLYLSCNAG